MKKDIVNIPFENLAFNIENTGSPGLEVTEFCKEHSLLTHSPWVLPQLLAEINTWTLVKDSDGRYSGNLTLAKNTSGPDVRRNYRNQGIWYLCMHSSRGDFCGTQHSPEYRDYSKLVPLILSSFKKFRNIPYQEWSDIESLVEVSLAQAMLCTYEDFDTEELLQLRVDGMKYSDGRSKARNPATTYGLFNIKGSRILELPILARIMLTQIWCAHPVNRTQYMVLNPKMWDDMPPALVSHDALFDKPATIFKSPKKERFIPPWQK